MYRIGMLMRCRVAGMLLDELHRQTPRPAFDLQTFLQMVTTYHEDGSISVVKTVPCDVGSTFDTCMVEVRCRAELWLRRACARCDGIVRGFPVDDMFFRKIAEVLRNSFIGYHSCNVDAAVNGAKRRVEE